MSQLFHTFLAHKFLSAIVYHVVQSLLSEISHNHLLQKIPEPPVPAYNVVRVLSGFTGSSFTGRIGYQSDCGYHEYDTIVVQISTQKKVHG